MKFSDVSEVAKCVKCEEYSSVNTTISLTSDPPQYQFECEYCSNKQFLWGSQVFRIPRNIFVSYLQMRMIEDRYRFENYKIELGINEDMNHESFGKEVEGIVTDVY